MAVSVPQESPEELLHRCMELAKAEAELEAAKRSEEERLMKLDEEMRELMAKKEEVEQKRAEAMEVLKSCQVLPISTLEELLFAHQKLPSTLLFKIDHGFVSPETELEIRKEADKLGRVVVDVDVDADV